MFFNNEQSSFTMNSMTGYGHAEGVCEGVSIRVEISSVNKKNLELYVALPRDLQSLERGVSDAVRVLFQRGKVSVYVQVKSVSANSGARWDVAQVQSTLNELKALAAQTGIAFDATPDLLLRVVQLVGQDFSMPEVEVIEGALQPLLQQALAQVAAMRATEGVALQEDIAARLRLLQDYAGVVREAAANTVINHREALLERLKQTQLEIDLADERLLRELALFADRSDITEELTRLESHFKQFFEFIESPESIGRKMDFLCQELNREVNTIGSKANNLNITRTVLDMKNEIERIREQVQNIE